MRDTRFIIICAVVFAAFAILIFGDIALIENHKSFSIVDLF